MKKRIMRNISEEEIKRSFSWFYTRYIPKPKTKKESQEFLNDWINHLIDQEGLVVMEDGKLLSENDLRIQLEREVADFMKVKLKEGH